MKLILAIVHNDDAPDITSALGKAGFYSTKIASTGGFLSAGNTTFITGVEDEKVDEVIRIISESGKKRSQYIPSAIYPGNPAAVTGDMIKVSTGGATIFVLKIENFVHV